MHNLVGILQDDCHNPVIYPNG